MELVYAVVTQYLCYISGDRSSVEWVATVPSKLPDPASVSCWNI